MTAYAWVGRTPVETVRDMKIDCIVMAMVRHHSSTPRDEADIVDYLLADGTLGLERFQILLRHIGPRRPFAAGEMTLTRPGGRVVLAKVDFGPECDMWWRDGVLTQASAQLPDTLSDQIRGRPLRDLVTHPYLPTDLAVATFRSTSIRWEATLGRPVER